MTGWTLAWLATLAALAVALLQWWRTRAALGRLRADAARDAEAREQRARVHAAADERERIYNDLHDDLGARLLTWIYEAETPAQADRARALLQDLRDVVTRSRGAQGTLAEVLGDIRAEVAQRLASVGMRLQWELPDDLPELELPNDRALHLYRIVREAVSNVIRHAHAGGLRVRTDVSPKALRIELTDDGSFFATDAVKPGAGVQAMRARAQELDGAIEWNRGTLGGTKVLLTVPLSGDAA